MTEHRTLTKRLEFSASHRYWNKKWSVSLSVDPDTGMVINIYKLKPIIKNVLKEFDHKFLNEDTDYFEELIPTTENFAKILYECITEKLNRGHCKLKKIRLYETKDLFVDYWR